MTVWNETAVAKLRALHGLGMSYAQIGVELGTTRCAVAGKLRALSGKKKRIGPPPTARPAIAAQPSPAAPLSKHVPLFELRWFHCRWITGHDDQGVATFCGHKKFSSSWCEHHHYVGRSTNINTNANKVRRLINAR